MDDAHLHAYLDGELRWSGESPALLERHLEVCADCRARLEEAKRLREYGRSLLGGDLPVERPPFEAVLRRAGREAEQPVARRRVPAAVWAASLVLALAGGWFGRGILDVRSPAREEVALRPSGSVPVPASARGGATAPPDVTAEAPPPPSSASSASSVRSAPPSEAPAESTVPPGAEPPALALRQPPGGAEPASVEAVPVVTTPPGKVDPPALAGAAPSAGRRPQSESGAVAIAAAPAGGGGIATIEGTVTDEGGRVIPGAVVQVSGLGVGTLTRPDGSYSLTVPEGRAETDDGLLITAAALGWESVTEPLRPDDRGTSQDFRLRPARVALEGVVAVGYGSAARSSSDAKAAGEEDEAGWTPARPGEIRRVLGREAFRIFGMHVREGSLGWVDGVRTVRIRQELPGGAVVTLLQWADPRGAAGAIAAPTSLQGPADRLGSGATTWRDGVRIVARAPLTVDSLTALLERLE